jgi:hypothetical protein
MPDENQEQPTREELVEARGRLMQQLAVIENPLRWTDRNPALITKIQGMIDELNECLAGLKPQSDPKSDAAEGLATPAGHTKKRSA